MAGEVVVDDIGRHRLDASRFSRLDIVDSVLRWSTVHLLAESNLTRCCLGWIGDQSMLTQGHCVSWAIADRLDDIRFLNAVERDDMRADLVAIVSIASAEVPSDLEWARNALEICLGGDVASRPGHYSWSAAA